MTKQQQQLVEDNINLVYFTIVRYYPLHKGNEDIIQNGMIGLCRAAIDYNPEKGMFSTYAIRKIRSAIGYEFRKDAKRIKTISLDAEREANHHGDTVTLQEAVMGDNDVDYVDTTPLCKVLTPQQRDVFDLLQQGKSKPEIAEILGISRQRVHQQLRVIQKKWSKTLDT